MNKDNCKYVWSAYLYGWITNCEHLIDDGYCTLFDSDEPILVCAHCHRVIKDCGDLVDRRDISRLPPL